MRSARRELQEERASRRGIEHEARGLCSEDIGRVVLWRMTVVSEAPVLHGRVVVVHGGVVVVLLREPRVPAGRNERTPVERIQVQVLADHARRVPRAVEPCRERRGIVEQVPFVVVLHAGVVGAKTGEQRGPRRTTQGRVEERVREPDPAAVRILELRLQVGHHGRRARDRLVGLVVGHEQDHVRSPAGVARRAGLTGRERDGDDGRHEGKRRDQRRRAAAPHPGPAILRLDRSRPRRAPQ